MLATLTLSALLVSGQSADKVSFAHRFTKGEALEYALKVKGDSDNGAMEVSASFTVTVGEKGDKGTNVTVSPKTLKMSMDGNEMDKGSSLSDSKRTLDTFGMPDSLSVEGANGVFTIPFVISYLPNKELSSGESFDVKWEKEGAYVKGSGKFDGSEKVGERALPKLVMKTAFHPGGNSSGEEAQLTYDLLFDPATGHVAVAKGKVTVGTMNFEFTLTKE